MTMPLDSHCARCLTPAPPIEAADYIEWESLAADGSVIVCPNCVTAEERQAMDDVGMAADSDVGRQGTESS
jgi:hypothetical protein